MHNPRSNQSIGIPSRIETLEILETANRSISLDQIYIYIYVYIRIYSICTHVYLYPIVFKIKCKSAHTALAVKACLLGGKQLH